MIPQIGVGLGTHSVDAQEPPMPVSYDHSRRLEFAWTRSGFEWKKTSGFLWEPENRAEVYLVYGKNGTKPGNAGNGGKQGFGGNGGKLLIFELGRPSAFVASNNNGNAGSIGKAGLAGNASQNGKINQVSFPPPTYFNEADGAIHVLTHKSDCPICFATVTVKTDYGKNVAVDGVDNTNDQGMLHPKPTRDFNHLSFILNKYKNFAREHLTGNTRETGLRHFMNKMANDAKVKLHYDTLGFVNELDTLESQYFRLRNTLPFIPFLESLLDRIDEFARANANMSAEYKKVLSYAYTATLSKIYGIKNKVNENTVFDLVTFLEGVEGNIDDLRRSVEDNNINIMRNEYKSSLDEKVKSANEFIDTQITPEFDNIFRQIDGSITALIEESIRNQNSTAEEIEEQKKRQNELKIQMFIRGALGAFKIVSTAANVFGPIGAAAGAAVGGGTMIIESLLLDENSAKGLDKIGSLVSPAFKASMSRMNEVLKQAPDLIKQKIYDLDKFVNDNVIDSEATVEVGVTDADIQELVDKIKQSKKTIDELNKDPNESAEWFAAINVQQTELKELSATVKEKLEKRTTELKEEETNAKQKVEKQLRIVTHVQAVVNVVDVSVQFYNQIRNDAAKVKLVADTIANLGDSLQIMKQHEAKIHDVLVPQIRIIENTVNDISKSLEGNSHVELDVKKWNIRKTLNEVRLISSQMTKDFKVSDAMEFSFRKLDEGMATLIDVYDRIDSYADNAKLAAYIANVGSVKSNEIAINDVELSDAVTSLQKMIRSNLVLEEHQMAMHAFGQHYFPLAQFFLQEFQLPESLQMNDTTSLIEKSVDQITKLKRKISTSQALYNEYDAAMHSDIYFDGEMASQPPFYVWKRHAIKNEMTALLKGDPITVKAAVEHGVNQNAIKFNDIGISMKSLDKNLQSELNDALLPLSVNMTMAGNGYYRCNNRYYSIPLDRELLISITFTKKRDKTPKGRNDVYKKINENKPFLSPYVMWTMQLTGDIRQLIKFINKDIDLELVGRGQYLEHGKFATDLCDERLDKYYRFDKTISTADDVMKGF